MCVRRDADYKLTVKQSTLGENSKREWWGRGVYFGLCSRISNYRRKKRLLFCGIASVTFSMRGLESRISERL